MAKKKIKTPYTYETSAEFKHFLANFDKTDATPDATPGTPPPIALAAQEAVWLVPTTLPTTTLATTAEEDNSVGDLNACAGSVSPAKTTLDDVANLAEDFDAPIVSSVLYTVKNSSTTSSTAERDDELLVGGSAPDLPTANRGVIIGEDLSIARSVPVVNTICTPSRRVNASAGKTASRAPHSVDSLNDLTIFLKGLSASSARPGPYSSGEVQVRLSQDLSSILKVVPKYMVTMGAGAKFRLDDLVDYLLRQFINEHVSQLLAMNESLLSVPKSLDDAGLKFK